MQRRTVLLWFGVFLYASYSQSFKIIGDLEAPEAGKGFKEGGGKEFEAVKHAVVGEKGDRGYDSKHFEEKGEKGVRDIEDHKKSYAESAGDKQAHKHDDGYYNEQHQVQKGERGFKFEDKGTYAKGHDTKGHHNIHKLNEYKKDTDFFDEDHDEAHKENHGGFGAAKAFSSGAASKRTQGQGGSFGTQFAKEGKFDKGHHYLDDTGFKKGQGYDGFFDKGDKFVSKGVNKAFKDFDYFKKV